jgi:hypothetical protein
MKKKSYEKPALIVHGSIEEITKFSLSYGSGDRFVKNLDPLLPRPPAAPSSGS